MCSTKIEKSQLTWFGALKLLSLEKKKKINEKLLIRKSKRYIVMF